MSIRNQLGAFVTMLAVGALALAVTGEGVTANSPSPAQSGPPSTQGGDCTGPFPSPLASPDAATAASTIAPGMVATPIVTAGASSAPGTTRIEVELLDNLRMDPCRIVVTAGLPVTFVVRNAGAAVHEFFLGDAAAQTAHGQEMASMGGMMHDEADGIEVAPGQTRELTFTFATPGESIAGCHEPGHYEAGMFALITIVG